MKQITTIFLAAMLVFSCTKDNEEVINVELEGQWELSDVTCFCHFGENPEFSLHQITFKGSELQVDNSGRIEFLTNAQGAYQVSGNLITLSDGSQYRYTTKGDSLTLTYVDKPTIADDELALHYIRS